tara:strand:- start:200 stop:823 length:624 start_codon:yes stop_codon:yes gene_type:complete
VYNFIISHGSAGSCWLDDIFEAERTNISHDITSFKFGCGAHMKSPNQLIGVYGKQEIRVLYPIRHPIETLMSYARRGFFEYPDHCQNIGGNMQNWIKFYRETNIPQKNDIPYIMNNLANVNYEIFEIKNHVYVWNNSKVNVKFVAYPDIPKRWEEICDYFNTDSKRKKISEWKIGNCNLSNLQIDTLEKLYKKYEKVIEFYEEIKIK